MNLRIGTFLAVLDLAAATAPHAFAGGSHEGSHGHGAAIGEPGAAAEADRVMKIVMTDNAYSVPRITVRAGETVRFVVANEGGFLHEFTIGTPAMHQAHRAEMVEMMERGLIDGVRMTGPMGHDDPNSILLEPGQSGEITWTFSEPNEIEFACNVPGHYEAGMAGPLSVTPRPGPSES